MSDTAKLPVGRIYGMTRASTLKQGKSPEVQTREINAYCEGQNWPAAEILDEPLGTSGIIKFRNRPQGRKILLNAKKGDVLIVTDVERIGRNAVDIMDTAERLRAKGVKLIILQFMGMDIDVSTEMGYLVLMIFAWGAQYEHRKIKERTHRAIQQKRDLGLLCYAASYGKRKIDDDDGAHWEWDRQQLRYIAEIAERLGKGEDIKKVANDFWRRKLKDHRGLSWGQIQRKPGKASRGSEYEHFRRAVRWWHRAKRAGQLPPPFCDIAKLTKETIRFTPTPRKYNIQKPAEINPMANWSAEQWREWHSLEFSHNSAECP